MVILRLLWELHYWCQIYELESRETKIFIPAEWTEMTTSCGIGKIKKQSTGKYEEKKIWFTV